MFGQAKWLPYELVNAFYTMFFSCVSRSVDLIYMDAARITNKTTLCVVERETKTQQCACIYSNRADMKTVSEWQ